MARSLLFNLLFYVTTTLFVVLGSPLLFAPRAPPPCRRRTGGHLSPIEGQDHTGSPATALGHRGNLGSNLLR